MAKGVTVNDKVWQKILANVKGAEKAHVKVGVLASQGGSASHDGITMVELAAIHEFGSPAAGIPERSFIRSTFNAKQRQLATFTAKLAREVVTNAMPLARALGLLGTWGAAEVKKTITEGTGVPPPLKPATVAAKGSDRPLVDTGRLLGSITYEVVE